MDGRGRRGTITSNETVYATPSRSIPDKFRQVDRHSVNHFKKCVRSCSESKKKVRVVIVGPKGSGKTCLIRRLSRQDIKQVESTDGIDIHVMKCKAKTTDGKWVLEKDRSYEEDMRARLLKTYINYRSTDVGTESEKNLTKSNVIEKDIIQDENFDNADKWEPTYANLTPTDDGDDYEDMKDTLKASLDDDDIAFIDFWDFAGDEEYYNTHHTFLSKDAVYIVTFDVSERAENDLSRYGLKFWLETIRCYGTDKTYDGDDKYQTPPVFVVGTHKDKFKGSDVECCAHLRDVVEKAVENKTTERLVRNYFLVSNTEDKDDDYNEMRRTILDAASSTSNWNRELPTRWIYLERALLKETSFRHYILAKEEILDLAAKLKHPIYDSEEVESFLAYHHSIGTYIYFKDIPEYVVLSPQWLVNALKCIIAADMFKGNLPVSSLKEWNRFRQTGRLPKCLVDILFSNQPSDIKEHKQHILNIMEKFYIIVRPRILSELKNPDQDLSYYVPCMMRSKQFSDIEDIINPTFKSSWLCLAFDFFPPPMVTCLLVAYSHELAVYSVPKPSEGRELVFYRDFAIFNLENNEGELLLILAYSNVIQMQVWKWGDNRQSYSRWKEHMVLCLDRLKSYFRLHVEYKVQTKCCSATHDYLNENVDLELVRSGTGYVCHVHNEFHDTRDMYNDWIGPEKEECLSKEQINATRMGIITLDILTDALYDRLVLHTSITKSRKECDISYLYGEIRKYVNLPYIPSKGKWGGLPSEINEAHTKIGDDVERIRHIRNELQHLASFSMCDKRFYEICRTVDSVLNRMQHHNNKGSQYIDRMKKVLNTEMKSKQWNDSKQKLMTDYPRLKMRPSFSVQIGDGCTLECEILSPIPHGSIITWFKGKNGRQTNLRENITLGSKYGGAKPDYPSLQIFNITKEDEDYYSCRIIYPPDCAEYDNTVEWPSTFLHVKPK